MNVFVPLVFSMLTLSAVDGVVTSGDVSDGDVPFSVAAGGESVTMVVPTDTVCLGASGLRVVSYDVLGDEGGSRRVLCVTDAAGRATGVRDGGLFGGECFADSLYITDLAGQTVTGVVVAGDASPTVAEAPEGGVWVVEMSDRLCLRLSGGGRGVDGDYVLRDNQVTYAIDGEGRLRLTSIRPRPDDVDRLLRVVCVYGDDCAEPMSGSQLASLLRRWFGLLR